MKNLTQWIKSHQIIAFVIITFVTTWGWGFSCLAVYKGELLLAPWPLGHLFFWMAGYKNKL